ncbi:hydrogenase maturation nickel metallochaperone HypA [Corynebacterium poyangense]|uniref:Hydrogenase maturation factor HypA n=1 Tax=Corynebacterium poyangense TaxID=2684405 RepID=A0A7H0SR60_9CORY|nr:hydrogenase maturation nickel metallochaperone HypA [Corynebacterium poyangense]MBZ8176462.1 hydrogenase maturation nickel metallochaperone HypA [Corynebacterium poyangense]QNQ91035.1 hydrogenase maturation nickel metallochaperone HypA [Corynebacterium poyangense]
MHELGLLSGVVDAVSEVAQGRRVIAVALNVGTRSGAVPEALDGAWPIARLDSCCAEAALDLTIIPATVWCPHCHREQEIDEFFDLRCPVCGTPTADLRHGREFHIKHIDVE